jgi:hypothetical protein
MNKTIKNPAITNISTEDILKLFKQLEKIEKEKIEGRDKVMTEQLSKAIQGKKILLSNKAY